ncbi:hypothetical protein NE237_003560 [Protea cynaroides]|uniref:Uncharacterized protein n=1 Tax=Protea cynaroides TaxID=273540 RepID=A0A9Q0KHN1_9MAGN|nr:hypothetical protein NE237_003560 [Protea cynaroides]
MSDTRKMDFIKEELHHLEFLEQVQDEDLSTSILSKRTMKMLLPSVAHDFAVVVFVFFDALWFNFSVADCYFFCGYFCFYFVGLGDSRRKVEDGLYLTGFGHHRRIGTLLIPKS